jgi:hypothetical protein
VVRKLAGELLPGSRLLSHEWASKARMVGGITIHTHDCFENAAGHPSPVPLRGTPSVAAAALRQAQGAEGVEAWS